MNPIEWSKKNTSVFIDLLKDRNCLWQVGCKDYKNKVLRDAAIKAITATMSRHIVGLNEEDIKKKINTLRTQFRRELRLLAASKKSATEVHEPKLWCFQKLHFLNEAEEQLESKSNLDDAVEVRNFCFNFRIMKYHSKCHTKNIRLTHMQWVSI